jgi:5'-3' exonuclease
MLLIVDLSSIYHPIWHAMPPTEPASAPHDSTVRRVRNLAEHAEHVAVCADSRKSWRKDLYPQYKANREARPDEMFVQLARVVETLRRDGFHVYEEVGYEADDLIATLVEQARPRVEVLIATADKDLYQLVGDHVSILPTRLDAEGNQPAPIRVPEVEAKFGVGPELVGDWLALTGDASDNIPGVPRIGPKTATGLLKQYGTLEIALTFAARSDPEMKPALRELLVTHADQARLSRKLVALAADAPIDLAAAMKPRVATSLPKQPDDEWDDHHEEEEESENMNDDSDAPPNTEPAQPADTNGAAASVARGELPTRTIEIEPRSPQPAPADALDRLAQFLPEPGTAAWAAALEPNRVEGAWKIATKLFDARIFQFTNVEQCFAAILLGRSLGLGVMTSCRNMHMIKGKLTLSVDLLVGLVKKSPLCEYFICLETTKQLATCETKRRGNPKPTRLTYDLEDAIEARLLPRDAANPRAPKSGDLGDSTWAKFLRPMLRHGCERELARMEYQDLTAGLYTPEELQDYSDLPAPRAA